jgi:hypothetical protein
LPYAITEIHSKLTQQRNFSGNPAEGTKEGSKKKVRLPKLATVYTTKNVSL